MHLDRRTLIGLVGLGVASSSPSGCVESVLPGGAPAGHVTAPDSRPNANDEQIAHYVQENAAFGIDILQALGEESPESNVMISPISISGALAMTWAGAKGETEAEMRETLRYPRDQEDLHPAVGALQYHLKQVASEDTDGKFELAVANALWGQKDYPFRDSYLETVEENYGSGFHEAEFSDAPDEARETINDWAANATNDRIGELFPEGSIDRLTRLVLTNAVYLLADWEHQFDPDDTEDGPFTSLDGSASRIPMMQQTEDFRYLADREAGYRVVELPYVGDSVAMVVVLPEAGTFASFEAALDAEWLTERFSELDAANERELSLTMPRFEFETESALGEYLRDLGMTTAFDPDAANFDGIAPPEAGGERLFIDEVYHDTYVAVDEEGTEAAAATGVDVGLDSAPPSMTVDRPFLFLIRDRETSTILFLGRAVDAETLS